jgi:LuxR family transcriptional regulator, maltose regulon positive regulatory protein
VPSNVSGPGAGNPSGTAVDLGWQRLPGWQFVRQERQGLPLFNCPLLPRPRLTELIDRATRHKVALVCGPARAGKTVACAQWAAAASGDRQVVWLTLSADEDKSWFWADLYGQLRRARLMPREAAAYLEDGSADGFPFRLVEMARQLTAPVVLVLDYAHTLDDRAVMAGLDVLIRHAPPALCLLFSGRHAPGIRLDRLRASGELAIVGAADLACTSGEADAYLAMAGREGPRAGRDELPQGGKCSIGERRHAAMWA